MVHADAQKDIHEMLTYIVRHMATKDDIADVRAVMGTKDDLADIRAEMATKEEMHEGFAHMRSEVTELRHAVDEVKEIVADHAGHAKEIDYAFERIAVLERHAGIKPAVV